MVIVNSVNSLLLRTVPFVLCRIRCHSLHISVDTVNKVALRCRDAIVCAIQQLKTWTCSVGEEGEGRRVAAIVSSEP